MDTTPTYIDKDACVYTACFCEENIYVLLKDHIQPADIGKYCVVVVSNANLQVPVFYQRAGDRAYNGCVIWDYHVFMMQVSIVMCPPLRVLAFVEVVVLMDFIRLMHLVKQFMFGILIPP